MEKYGMDRCDPGADDRANHPVEAPVYAAEALVDLIAPAPS
jgi:hypothetical protein